MTTEPGEQLRDEIAAAGLSQRKVAEDLGVSPQAVTNWVNGHKRPLFDHIVELETILGVEPRGRLLAAFGYASPTDGNKPMSIRAAVRAHPDLEPEDKRALLTVIKRFLPDET